MTSLVRPSSIVWYHNDTVIPIQAESVSTATGPNTYLYGSVLARDNVALNDSGLYCCQAQNMAGIASDNITISVISKYMYLYCAVIVYLYAT